MGSVSSIRQNCEEQAQDPAKASLRRALSRVQQFYDIARLNQGVIDLRSIVSLMRYALDGSYKVDSQTLMILGGAIIYVVMPCDAIPDVIPIVGYFDDAYVLRQAVNACISEIRRFQEWEKEQQKRNKKDD